MEVEPLKHYLKARDAFRDKQPALALEHLRASLGVTKEHPLLEHTLPQALDPETAMGEAILALVTHASS